MNDTPPDAEAKTEVEKPGPSASPAPGPRQRKRAVDNPTLILLTLFGVTAALGLPLLWMSKGFSPKMKVVWSVVVLIYTVVILWLFYLVMAWAVGRIVEYWPY